MLIFWELDLYIAIGSLNKQNFGINWVKHKSLLIFLKLASGQKEQLFWANINWSVCVLLLVLWEFNIYVLQLYSE